MTVVLVAVLVVGIPIVFTVAGTYTLVAGGTAVRWLLDHRRPRVGTPRAVARIRRSVA